MANETELIKKAVRGTSGRLGISVQLKDAPMVNVYNPDDPYLWIALKFPNAEIFDISINVRDFTTAVGALCVAASRVRNSIKTDSDRLVLEQIGLMADAILEAYAEYLTRGSASDKERRTFNRTHQHARRDLWDLSCIRDREAYLAGSTDEAPQAVRAGETRLDMFFREFEALEKKYPELQTAVAVAMIDSSSPQTDVKISLDPANVPVSVDLLGTLVAHYIAGVPSDLAVGAVESVLIEDILGRVVERVKDMGGSPMLIAGLCMGLEAALHSAGNAMITSLPLGPVL